MTLRPVAVVTDSACSLPASLASARGIHVVPLLLTVGDTTYRDGDLSLGDMLGRIEAGVSTSGPTPGEFAEAAETLLRDHDHVIVLTIAHTMSSTYESARSASQLFDSRVRVVDTATAAGAQGLVVLAAAASAAAGASVEEVEAEARRAIERVRLVATVPRLDFLVHSGRVPGIAGWAGGKLGVNPMFQFSRGGVHPLRPAFSRDAALDRIVGAWRSAPRGVVLRVAALHALADEEASGLLEAVRAEVEPETAFVGEFSPVMVAHTGPGLVGLAWWWD